jgi:uncharacterized protein (TIGR02466 family)
MYWHFHVGSIDLDDKIQLCQDNDEWACHVKTSRKAKTDWSGFFNLIEPVFKQLPFKAQNFQMTEPWMNVYEIGAYQEAHNHAIDGNNLAYCYFYKLPPNSGAFRFYNEQFRNFTATNLDATLMLKELNIDEWGTVDVKEGDLLVFPSFLIHNVTRNKTAQLRVTVSGNVRVV